MSPSNEKCLRLFILTKMNAKKKDYVKIFEEMRCIRCVLERILRVMDEGLFVDYQMEKFGRNYKTKEVKNGK